ncbi:hypothetical protein FOMPIDRAFT_110230 [Fomitopsis schrenkii]|uniref:Uncharacterized protein n=1 Tax=Fomitopsis schrenkii TaxID=2126942 RepID=S8DXL4_FOMSC|nr:hypothetical protein FOMPIDRAFT_110230 [Fomitopsis schrenkii]
MAPGSSARTGKRLEDPGDIIEISDSEDSAKAANAAMGSKPPRTLGVGGHLDAISKEFEQLNVRVRECSATVAEAREVRSLKAKLREETKRTADAVTAKDLKDELGEQQKRVAHLRECREKLSEQEANAKRVQELELELMTRENNATELNRSFAILMGCLAGTYFANYVWTVGSGRHWLNMRMPKHTRQTCKIIAMHYTTPILTLRCASTS